MRRYAGVLVALVVFVVLLVVVLLTQNGGSSSNTTPTSLAAASPTVNADLQIIKLGANEQATGLELKTMTGTLQLKFDNNQWKETAPTSQALDSATISDTIGQLTNLQGQSAISADKAGDLAAFGLDKPTLTVNLQTGSSTKTLLFGALNPASGNYYVKLGDGPKVWTLSSFLYNTLNTWLTQPPLPPPTIALTGSPQTPLPTLTPTPSAAPVTPTPPSTTTAATTTAASTTASGTTAPATTTAAATTASPTK